MTTHRAGEDRGVRGDAGDEKASFGGHLALNLANGFNHSCGANVLPLIVMSEPPDLVAHPEPAGLDPSVKTLFGLQIIVRDAG